MASPSASTRPSLVSRAPTPIAAHVTGEVLDAFDAVEAAPRSRKRLDVGSGSRAAMRLREALKIGRTASRSTASISSNAGVVARARRRRSWRVERDLPRDRRVKRYAQYPSRARIDGFLRGRSSRGGVPPVMSNNSSSLRPTIGPRHQSTERQGVGAVGPSTRVSATRS